MGLDLVELALRVEDEFDISISDADLEQATTPRKLAEVIYRKYQMINSENHLLQSSFYRVRNIFIKNFGFSKKELHPDTKISKLFEKDIISNWNELNRCLPHKIYYSLGYTRKNIIIIWGVSLLIVILLGYVLHFTFCNFIFSTLGIFAIIYISLKPYVAKIPPKEVQTLADLIRYVGGSKKIDKYKSEKEILDKVIEISIDELGLNPEEIHPDSHYVDDLGAG